jgi:hypothetical protein
LIGTVAEHKYHSLIRFEDSLNINNILCVG